jgi:hypothetical protein
LQDRQIGRFLALEDAAYIEAGAEKLPPDWDRSSSARVCGGLSGRLGAGRSPERARPSRAICGSRGGSNAPEVA